MEENKKEVKETKNKADIEDSGAKPKKKKKSGNYSRNKGN